MSPMNPTELKDKEGCSPEQTPKSKEAAAQTNQETSSSSHSASKQQPHGFCVVCKDEEANIASIDCGCASFSTSHC